MSENRLASSAPPLNWTANLDIAVCEHCHWRYLVPCGEPPICPNCWQGHLSPLPDGLPDMPRAYLPELIVPYTLTHTALAGALNEFYGGIPFAPAELNEPALRARMTPVYLPMWLVDGQVTGIWQAEAGFNYAVVSHQEAYDGDLHRWQSREIKEPRVRWENRAGQISRAYQNITAPALDDALRLEKQLGPFNLDSARSFDPDCLSLKTGPACVRLPDHPPQEAWGEAAAAFQKTASAEVQQACAADHLRQFHWKAQFTHLNWTLLLLPLYCASYLDDNGRPQPILIHGQTGKINGTRKASMRRARQTSLYLLLAGILFFLIGLFLDTLSTAQPIAGTAAAYILILGFAGIVAAAVPLLIVWDFNHRQALEQAETRLK